METYALQRVSGPFAEPVSLEEAKLHLRVDDDLTADDELIETLISAAREYCEECLGQSFVTQTWKLFLDCFPSWEIELPRSPLASVTHVKYLDTAGVQQTMSSSLYLVDAASKPGRIQPIWSGFWPTALYQTNSVEIQFVTGVALANVPARVKQAMKLLVGHWYANRESVIVGATSTKIEQTVDALLSTLWTGAY